MVTNCSAEHWARHSAWDRLYCHYQWLCCCKIEKGVRSLTLDFWVFVGFFELQAHAWFLYWITDNNMIIIYYLASLVFLTLKLLHSLPPSNPQVSLAPCLPPAKSGPAVFWWTTYGIIFLHHCPWSLAYTQGRRHGVVTGVNMYTPWRNGERERERERERDMDWGEHVHSTFVRRYSRDWCRSDEFFTEEVGEGVGHVWSLTPL